MGERLCPLISDRGVVEGEGSQRCAFGERLCPLIGDRGVVEEEGFQRCALGECVCPLIGDRGVVEDEGMPVEGTDQKGKLYMTFDIQFPTQL